MDIKLKEVVNNHTRIINSKSRTDWQSVTDEMNSYSGETKNKTYYRNRYIRMEPVIANKQISSYIYDGKTGEQTFIKTCPINEKNLSTPEMIMQEHDLKSDNWQVMQFTSNVWPTVIDGVPTDLWQSKLTVKPITKSELTFDDIDRYFAKKDFSNPKPLISCNYHTNGEILEIDFTDSHNGLLSWKKSTGADYDIKIAVERFRRCIGDVIERCENKKIKKIMFVGLGDILHVDNDSNTTTKGTSQDVDGRIEKIFDIATDMLIDCLDKLMEIAPVEYIHIAGNHDKVLGYMLAKTLQMAYRHEKNITFDISPNPQKYRMIGVDTYLIGMCHGDMPKKNLGEWLQRVIRTKIGKCKFASVHCGHLHNESTYTDDGILIKHLPALCESSYWEHHEGYQSDKALMCFVYDENVGLRETWITNI